jgi:hypothetical protein
MTLEDTLQALNLELESMQAAYEALIRLTPEERGRAMRWLADRLVSDERRDAAKADGSRES